MLKTRAFGLLIRKNIHTKYNVPVLLDDNHSLYLPFVEYLIDSIEPMSVFPV